MKLGLANLAVLFVLEKYTWKEAALVSLVRILVVGFLFGNGSGIMYSLAGATLSLTVMVLVKKKAGFSHLGVSVAGGVSHNIGQLLVAIPVTHTIGLLYYYARSYGFRCSDRTADRGSHKGGSEADLKAVRIISDNAKKAPFSGVFFCITIFH